MKEIVRDKPRIASTVILGIFLSLCLFILIVFLPVGWQMVKEAADGAAASGDSPAASTRGGAATACVGSVAVVLIMFCFFGVIFVSSICLPFAIRNYRSTLKPIRIISYVYDGLFGVTLIASIVKVILLFCGI